MIKIYFQQTKNLHYALVSSIPLLLGYELLVWHSPPHASGAIIRNGVEVMLNDILSAVGLNLPSAGWVLLVAITLGLVYTKHKGAQINLRFYAMAIVESSLYAVVMAYVLKMFSSALLQIAQYTTFPDLMHGIGMSLGAGIYEELIFRAVLISLMLWIFKLFLSKYLAGFLAVILAAFLFSLAHYVGATITPFTVDSFMYRWFAGLILSSLFYSRGFMLTAYTHAFYNIGVILISP